MSDLVIPDEARWVTGAQAIRSPRWPFSRDQFYKLVKRGLITRIHIYEGARPVYSVEEIDRLYSTSDTQQRDALSL